MKIEIRKSGVKDLHNISEQFKVELHNKILQLTDFENMKDIEKLTNFQPAYRVRVGDYKILFDVLDEAIVIGRILDKKDV